MDDQHKNTDNQTVSRIKGYYKNNHDYVNREYDKQFSSVELTIKKKYVLGYRSLFVDAINLLKSQPKDKSTLNRNETDQFILNKAFDDISNKQEIFENVRASGACNKTEASVRDSNGINKQKNHRSSMVNVFIINHRWVRFASDEKGEARFGFFWRQS